MQLQRVLRGAEMPAPLRNHVGQSAAVFEQERAPGSQPAALGRGAQPQSLSVAPTTAPNHDVPSPEALRVAPAPTPAPGCQRSGTDSQA